MIDADATDPSVDETDDNVIRPTFGRATDSPLPEKEVEAVAPAKAQPILEALKDAPPSIPKSQTASTEPIGGNAPPATSGSKNQSTSVGSATQIAIVDKPRRAKWWLLAAGVVCLIKLIRLLPGSHTRSAPLASTDTLYVIRDDAVVRSAATAQGSEIVTKLARGTQVVGVWETQSTGSKWLRIAQGAFAGDFIWDRNLSPKSPPAMTQPVNSYMTVTQLAQLRDAPSSDANVVEVVRPGLRLFVAGTVEGGWMEIPLRRGGVGYLPSYAMQ